MTKLLTATALACVQAMPLLAQTARATDMPIFRDAVQPTNIRASDLIGMRVYQAEPLDADAVSGQRDGWNHIGEVRDIILARDGSAESVLIDIGGPLRLGERQVAVNMSALHLVADDATADMAGDFFLVVTTPAAKLSVAPEWSMTDYEALAIRPRATDGAAAERPMTERRMIERDGFSTLAVAEITAELLTGARVYDAADARIGEVSNIILTEDGRVASVIVDVGGFLGIGEKPVSLSMDELQILRANEAGAVSVYVNHSREPLEAMETYQG